jgi:hypothetical protein
VGVINLDIVCDICQIKMHAIKVSDSAVSEIEKSILQFMRDHHTCDPDVGVRIVNLRRAAKGRSYLDVAKDTE